MQHIYSIVSDEFNAVNQFILEQLYSDVSLVEEVGHYLVDAGGKRLRPLVVLLAAGCCDHRAREQIALAAVIEFLHTATLLHDDVVDVSSLRRGRPTANAKWGNASSVLVGDFLYSRAFQMLVNIGNIEVMQILSNATNTIAEGEVLQLTKAGDPATTEDDYYRVIYAKTAMLFEAATHSSAVLANTEAAQLSALKAYGLHLGMAFQLTDDYLDYCGNPLEMGKNIGDDLVEGKPTLPLIYTMRHGSSESAAHIRRVIEEKNSADLATTIEHIKNSGALYYTLQQARRHSDLASKALDILPASPYKNGLLSIAEHTVNRTK